VLRRAQLTGMLTAERNRRTGAPAAVRRSLDLHIASLKRYLPSMDQVVAKFIRTLLSESSPATAEPARPSDPGRQDSRIIGASYMRTSWRSRMPTVRGIPGPYRIFFFSFDCNEPRHMHVSRERMLCKFWLEPVALARNSGFSRGN